MDRVIVSSSFYWYNFVAMIQFEEKLEEQNVCTCSGSTFENVRAMRHLVAGIRKNCINCIYHYFWEREREINLQYNRLLTTIVSVI